MHTKSRILYDSIYMRCSEQTNPYRLKTDAGSLGLEGIKGVVFFSGVMKMSKIDCDEEGTTEYSKVTELYTTSGGVVWYENHISLLLFT